MRNLLATKIVIQHSLWPRSAEWISRLLKATNYGNLTYIVDLYCVEDPIYLEERKGLKLAPEYKKNFNNIFDIYVEEIKFMYGIDVKPQNGINWRYELVKMQAGGLLTRVANDMSAKAFCKVKPDQPYCKEDNVADLKYRVFSMHDTNVLGVLNSFDFPKVDYNRNDNVELGSSLFFELWNDEEKDRKYVKIIYRRSPEEIYDLSEQIRGCKSIGKGLGCSLDDFLRRTDKYLIPSSEKYCAQKLPQLGTFETIPQVHFKL
uniref:acid phosphatase n=1 Tax=Bursaphelenchus xylophilus TaxID=6326 RepID=A0A1I7SJU7_BURXY